MWVQKKKVVMPPAVEKMYEDLINRLQEAEQATEDRLEEEGAAIAIVQQSIEALREYVLGNPFTTREEEIYFFKEIKPRFYAHHIYFTRCYRIELRSPMGSIDTIKAYYKKCLLSMELDFDNHAEFYQYYRSGADYLDGQYFVRGKKNSGSQTHPFYVDADPHFSTGYDYQVAELIANERLSEYLNAMIKVLDMPNEMPEKLLLPDGHLFTWRLPVIYLVELIYALYALAPFGEPKPNITNMAYFFSKVFNIKITFIHKKLEELGMRKKSRTVLLDLLRQAYIQQLEKDDLKEPRK